MPKLFGVNWSSTLFYSQILQCLFPKSKDSLLHKHNTAIKGRKLTLMQYYYLTHNVYSNFENNPNIIHYSFVILSVKSRVVLKNIDGFLCHIPLNFLWFDIFSWTNWGHTIFISDGGGFLGDENHRGDTRELGLSQCNISERVGLFALILLILT